MIRIFDANRNEITTGASRRRVYMYYGLFWGHIIITSSQSIEIPASDIHYVQLLLIHIVLWMLQTHILIYKANMQQCNPIRTLHRKHSIHHS